MDFALGVIVVVGVAMGDPFIKPYAIEAGLPAALAPTRRSAALWSRTQASWPGGPEGIRKGGTPYRGVYGRHYRYLDAAAAPS